MLFVKDLPALQRKGVESYSCFNAPLWLASLCLSRQAVSSTVLMKLQQLPWAARFTRLYVQHCVRPRHTPPTPAMVSMRFLEIGRGTHMTLRKTAAVQTVELQSESMQKYFSVFTQT